MVLFIRPQIPSLRWSAPVMPTWNPVSPTCPWHPQTEILKNVHDAHFSDYYSCIYVQWTHVFIMDLHHSDRSMNFLLVFVKLIRQTTENGEWIWAPPLPPSGHIRHRRSFDSFEVRKDFHLRPFERVVLLHPLDPGRSVLSPAALHTYKHT